jgi:hypothetical protein
MAKRTDPTRRLHEYQQQYRALTAHLADIGFIWPGSINRLKLRCGKPTCVCHKDPQARHGPYPYWTSKKNQKTISRLLDPEEAEL